MNDNIFEKIVDKLFSGSFSMLVLIGSTYCMIILSCVYLTAKGKIATNDFLLLVGGLGTVFMALWKDYLGVKKDQPTNGGIKNGKETNGNGNPVVSDPSKGGVSQPEPNIK